MSYDGNGIFLINTSGQPVITGTVISSTAFNLLTADLATGLSTCITKDGQTAVTANIPMGGFKVTGIGVATTTGDALSYGRAAVVTTLSATSLATSAATPLLLTNGQLVNVALTSQTVGATTLTIPDFASVVDEFTFKTKSQTMSNKTFVAPALGAATATSINGLTITSSTGTLTIAASKTLTASNTLTFTGTDGSSVAFGAGGTVLYSGGSGFVSSVAQSFTGGLISVGGSPITTSGTLALTVAGTSGGIPYFSSGTTWATSAALAANAIVIGGGAGAAPRQCRR